MKRYVYIFCLISFAACKGNPTQHNATDTVKDTVKKTAKKTVQPVITATDTIFKPFKLVADFVVADTGYFDFGIGDGTYAVIKKDGTLIDTIDYMYKFQPVDSDLYAYYKIEGEGPLPKERSSKPDKKAISANIGSYIIVNTNGRKVDVSNLAPDFGWFANPSLINGAVYYWQVKEFKKENLISAAKFDPKTGKTVRLYLFNDDIETDDGGYFKQAERKNGSVIFTSPQRKEYIFSPDFKLIQ